MVAPAFSIISVSSTSVALYMLPRYDIDQRRTRLSTASSAMSMFHMFSQPKLVDTIDNRAYPGMGSEESQSR